MLGRAVTIAALATVLGGVALAGQESPPSLSPGQRVRVWTVGEGVRGEAGTLLPGPPDTLHLATSPGAEPLRLPLGSLERLEVSLGRRTPGEGAMRGAGVGLLAGAGAGFLLGTALGGVSGQDCADDCGLTRAILTFVGMVAGPVSGGAVGAVRPGERWERVPLPARLPGPGEPVAAVAALAADPPSLPAPAAAACFRPRPAPACRSFWITEAGIDAYLTPAPEGARNARRLLLAWEVGRMVSLGDDRAIGGGVFAAVNDQAFRLGVRGRYRRWREGGSPLDVAPGLVLLSTEEGLRPRPALGLVLSVTAGSGDLFRAVGQVETVPGRAGAQVGARVGSVLGVGLVAALPLLVAPIVIGSSR